MQFFWQDLRYGFRALLRNPGFCAVAVLALALGIGPNTAIFTMVNAVLLQPLPVPDPGRVVMIWETQVKAGFDQFPVSAADFLDWQQEAHSFDQMSAAFTIPEFGLNVSGAGDPERVPAALASKEFLPALGIKPIVGRNFAPDEDRPGGRPAVLISHALWQRRFHSDPAAVGRTLTVDGIARTVVGVVPHALGEIVAADLWLPTAIDPNNPERGNHNYGVVARLKPGVTVAQARAEMAVIAARLEKQYPATNAGTGMILFPMAEMFAGRIRPVLLILLGAVGVLLLIACANLANLLLARAATREKEIAIRGALGAGRLRLIRQLLTESLVLALAGGTLGLALAVWGVRVLRSIVPDMFPMLQHMQVDTPVLAFTFGISILTGLLFGLVPAWRASHTDLNTTLKEAAGRSESAGGSHRIRSLLLGGEVALAVLLSVSAGLLLRSFVLVTEVNPGVRTANILTMNVSLPVAEYDTPVKRANFYKDLIARLDTLPGVRSAGAVMFLPLRVSILSFRVAVSGFTIQGRPPLGPDQQQDADYRTATPGYFSTMGIALRQGRLFDGHDDTGAKPVVLVNEALVRRYFPHENPLGQHLVMRKPLEIVGVVADAKLYGLDTPVEPAVYLPQAQAPGSSAMAIVVRTEGDPAALTAAVRREILRLDPEQPVSNVRTMQTVFSDSLTLRRVSMMLLMVFASLALTLASVGVYGLTAYAVSRRTHEIGLRVALGASQSHILRLVVGRELVTSLIGSAIGVGAALLLTRGLAGMLYGVTPRDPLVFAGVPLLLIAVSVLASYVPARRATRIDPLVALRYE
ncbi:MAG TPA: ABC transporter permease [Bryobacteraceae bacterium]|jgi:putative ABC transport system permease protein|nr:ABC transporter permease [Bryobacteraceae bacterium]